MKNISRADALQEVTASSNRSEQPTPRFARFFLAFAVLLMMIHYTFGEWVFHPELKHWKQWAFWPDLFRYAALPVILWCGWKVISLGRLKISRVLFIITILLCVGDAFFYMVPSILRSLQSLHYHEFETPVERWSWVSYWYVWTFWMPVVLIIGNLVLLKRWWGLFGPAFSFWRFDAAKKKAAWSAVILESLAIVTATTALGLTAIHLWVSRLPINDTTSSLAETFLVQFHLKGDFEYLISNPAYHGRRLGAILTHVELADLQRKQFFPDLDESTFRRFILSPDVDDLPLNEIDWRRTLWENFYPRIRHESDVVAAAQIVVRFLRERVGIDPGYRYRVGVETIWTQQMTNEAGFERIYVAALRSVGIAARLNEQKKTELWTGKKWQTAPGLLIPFRNQTE
jgi:hypothetical protein